MGVPTMLNKLIGAWLHLDRVFGKWIQTSGRLGREKRRPRSDGDIVREECLLIERLGPGRRVNVRCIFREELPLHGLALILDAQLLRIPITCADHASSDTLATGIATEIALVNSYSSS